MQCLPGSSCAAVEFRNEISKETILKIANILQSKIDNGEETLNLKLISLFAVGLTNDVDEILTEFKKPFPQASYTFLLFFFLAAFFFLEDVLSTTVDDLSMGDLIPFS